MARMKSLGFNAYQLVVGLMVTRKRLGQVHGVSLNYHAASQAWTISTPVLFTVEVPPCT
jgi:hypothetical protein